MTKQDFISHKMSILIREGYPQAQAYKIAESYWDRREHTMQQGGSFNLPKFQWAGMFDLNSIIQSQTMSPQQDFSVKNQDYLRNIHTPAQNYPINNINYSPNNFNSWDLDNNNIPDLVQSSENNPVVNQDSKDEKKPMTKEEYFNRLKLLNPYGDVDIPVASHMLGQSLAYKGDKKGWNALRGIASAGKIGLGLTRGVLSGYTSQKMWNENYQDYLKNQKDQGNLYTAYQEGGKISNAEAMTGAYTIESPMPNVEIEKNEFLKDGETQEVTKAIGETHENGGIKTQLTDKTKVISDHTQIGAKNAKKYREEFDINVKASDTFAKVLDKVQSKIGLKKLIKEEAEIISEIEKTNKKGIDKDTLDINMQFLQKKALEVQQQKQPLEDLQKVAFESIFADQEKIPKKGQKQGEAQLGGTMFNDQIIGLSKQYNLAPERVEELLKMEGGGGFRISNAYEDPEKFIQQHPTDDSWKGFGEVIQKTPQEVLAENARIHPTLYKKYLADNKYKDYNNIRKFQEEVNKHYENTLKEVEKSYGKDSDIYKQIQQDVEKSKFLPIKQERGKQNVEVRGFDSLWGNFTSTRPNYRLPVLPPEELKKVTQAGVTTSEQLKEKYPDLYDKYIKPKGLTTEFFLGEIPTPNQTNITQEESVKTDREKTPETIYKERVLSAMPMFPSDMILTPSNIMPIKKAEVAFERMTPVKQSIEPNVVEAQRQTEAAMKNFSYLPDNQRAAILSEYITNQGNVVNDALSKAEATNVAMQQQADQFNIGQRGKEDLMNIQFAQDYQTKALMGLDNYERRLQAYYNKLSAENKQKFADIRGLNLLNATAENFQTTGNDIYFMNNPINVQNNSKSTPMSQEDMKKWRDAQKIASEIYSKYNR